MEWHEDSKTEFKREWAESIRIRDMLHENSADSIGRIGV